MEKLLFTGGTGFLGYNVLPRLNKIYEVTKCGITLDDDIKANLAIEVPFLLVHYVVVRKHDSLRKSRRARRVLHIADIVRIHARGAAAQLLLYSLHVIHMPVSSDVGRGKVTMKREPCGLFCPTAIEPPCALTASCTMLSPRPLPPASRERALSTR